ncbi:hypothetical protein ACO22_00559 [Paracoccidioides brasiliensis]|uniref:DASH complex subunit Hsk3 like-domain-containing protein n=1 Tax=Paracoccidioides brasiliensis TaxID=121759 RepID=A0A1D2JNZ8_PARBR|nr:hypothetical protein ACO22_00559 [Paracoccidioides brasiliensis]
MNIHQGQKVSLESLAQQTIQREKDQMRKTVIVQQQSSYNQNHNRNNNNSNSNSNDCQSRSRPSSATAAYTTNLTTNPAYSTSTSSQAQAQAQHQQLLPQTSMAMSTAKTRQYAQLHSQLAQLNAHLADMENLMRMTAAQAGDMRFLGGYVGGMFMGAAKVLGEEGGDKGGGGAGERGSGRKGGG